MATIGESSSSVPKLADGKPVLVRVKRKASQSRLDALCELGHSFVILSFDFLLFMNHQTKFELSVPALTFWYVWIICVP